VPCEKDVSEAKIRSIKSRDLTFIMWIWVYIGFGAES